MEVLWHLKQAQLALQAYRTLQERGTPIKALKIGEYQFTDFAEYVKTMESVCPSSIMLSMLRVMLVNSPSKGCNRKNGRRSQNGCHDDLSQAGLVQYEPVS